MSTKEEEFKRLKKENRRRLLGAFVLVALASFIIYFVMDSRQHFEARKEKLKERQTIEINKEILNQESNTQQNISLSEEENDTGIIVDSGYGKEQNSVTENDLPPVVNVTSDQQAKIKATNNIQHPVSPIEKKSELKTKESVRVENKQASSTQINTTEKKASEMPKKIETKESELKNKKEVINENQIKQSEKKINQPSKTNPKEILQGKKEKQPVVSKKKVAIQVIAYNDGIQAESMKAKLISKGFPARVEQIKSNNKTLYRVRVGNYSDSNEAQKIVNKINSSGFGVKAGVAN